MAKPTLVRGGGYLMKGNKELVNNILNSETWKEFENNFEEGWYGEPGVNCLANLTHHREVSALAVLMLSQKYVSDMDAFAALGTRGVQEYYDHAAKQLYPDEKLWSGDMADTPEWEHAYNEANHKVTKDNMDNNIEDIITQLKKSGLTQDVDLNKGDDEFNLVVWNVKESLDKRNIDINTVGPKDLSRILLMLLKTQTAILNALIGTYDKSVFEDIVNKSK